jgi:hypothetical protein
MFEIFFNPAQLRARALHLREMAEEFHGEDMERHLLKVAEALDTRAEALERQRLSLAASDFTAATPKRASTSNSQRTS